MQNLTWGSAYVAASTEASPMKDGLLGPRLDLGHKAPMHERGIAGASPRSLSLNPARVSLLKEPRVARGRN